MRPDLTDKERAQVEASRKWYAEHGHEWGSEASPDLAERMRDEAITSAYLRRHPENIRLLQEIQSMTEEEREALDAMTEDQRRAKFPWFFAAHEANPD